MKEFSATIRAHFGTDDTFMVVKVLQLEAAFMDENEARDNASVGGMSVKEWRKFRREEVKGLLAKIEEALRSGDGSFISRLGNAITARNRITDEKADQALTVASIDRPQTLGVLRKAVEDAGCKWQDVQIYRRCKKLGIEIRKSKPGPKRVITYVRRKHCK